MHLSNMPFLSLIIGGRKADAHSRPYMAYLEIKNGRNTTACGGFLIRPDAVLSAAHCMDKKGTVKVTVTLGAHNIRRQERSQQKIRAGKWVIHPQYSRKDGKNDIVLLKVWPNTSFLPEGSPPAQVGDLCTVSGWGWTSKAGDMSDVLMEVALKVQYAEICEQLSNNFQCQSMICVGDEEEEKATYKGDSGGPLVCNKKAHGIVSHGYEDCLFPEIFTRISHFEPWIQKQLKRFSRKAIPCFPFSD
uniref:Uncharacterized protein n=1 Tax=Geospiza parvula TaxID=87175 RepID=A0A8C3NG77_GEOPR